MDERTNFKTMNVIKIHPDNNSIWNTKEFVEFLSMHQHLSIVVELLDGACAETIGLYHLLDQFQFTSVTILTPNPLEQHKKYNIRCIRPWFYFDPGQTDYNSMHYWNKKFIFGFFYNRPMWHRIGLASWLQVHHKDITQINIRCNPNNNDHRHLFEVQKLFSFHRPSFQNFSKVMDTWPISVEETDTYTMGGTPGACVNQLIDYYPNFLIEIVGETWITGNVFTLTEKTIRPMALKKPFILMGSKDSLDYLHQMGFYTFNEFWDESYDGFENADRYVKILNLIDNLSKKSKDELDSLYHSMKYQLDHNYELIKSQSFKKTITKIS